MVNDGLLAWMGGTKGPGDGVPGGLTAQETSGRSADEGTLDTLNLFGVTPDIKTTSAGMTAKEVR